MDVYSILLEKMSKQEIEEKISEKIKNMAGFLTRDAAINLIFNESGIKSNEKITLSKIKEGVNRASVNVKLERVLKLQTLENGKKMRKIVVSDKSGERELSLWNKDTELVNTLHSGDLIELKGIYCKNNTLSLGYSGEIKTIQQKSFTDIGALAELDGLMVNVLGYVESIEGAKIFVHQGKQRKLFSFFISNGTTSVRTVIWDSAENGKKLFIGSKIKIENAKVKNKELHLNSFSRLFVKKKIQGVRKKIDSLECANEKMILTIEGKKHKFKREEALKILNTAVADDIKLKTIIELKKDEVLGKELLIPF